MFRIVYSVCIIALLSGTAWTAANASSQSPRAQTGLGLVLLAALQR